MVNSVSILGSTGSIGRQSLEVCREKGIPVAALAARSGIELLEQQVREFHPALVAVYDEAAAETLRQRLSDTDTRVLSGEEGLCTAAASSGADCVVTAVSGSVGLRPTLAAIDAGLRIALANKETLVCAGELVMKSARERGAEIIPVDSEHSAIFQCIEGRRDEVRKLLLTGSGGPFRGKTREEQRSVRPQEAIRHPNWSMGAKISVDSATLMNKGLEFIEAMHLFSVSPEDIEVVIQPESVIHSMVELLDGTVIAQLGPPDMKLPIQYALTYPQRLAARSERLDFSRLGSLSFAAPDLVNFPCLALAIACAKRGGSAPAVMSAANEEAVALFLKGEIGFCDIYDCVAAALDSINIISSPALEQIIEADTAARVFIKENFGKCI